jgi:hypothetical protein
LGERTSSSISPSKRLDASRGRNFSLSEAFRRSWSQKVGTMIAAEDHLQKARFAAVPVCFATATNSKHHQTPDDDDGDDDDGE